MLVLERGGGAARIHRDTQLRQCFVLPQGLFSVEIVFLSGVYGRQVPGFPHDHHHLPQTPFKVFLKQ